MQCLWKSISLVLLSALAFLVTGCTAATVGLALGIVALADSGGSRRSNVDSLPTVTFLEQPEFLDSPEGFPSPYRMLVRFKITNEDAGALSARVEVVKLEKNSEVNLGEAVPLDDSDPIVNIPNDSEVSFRWDVEEDLGEGSAMVRFLITPIEDGQKARPRIKGSRKAQTEKDHPVSPV